MFIGIEIRTTVVNGKRYLRCAPFVTGTERQKLVVGSIALFAAFIIVMLLIAEPVPQTTTTPYGVMR